jgi:phage FluMu gp28-like protein
MKIGKIDKTVAVRLKNDANYFCEKILGVKLHHYQQQVVNEKHRNLAMCWSRQTGKTFLLSIKAVHEAVTFVPTETKKEFLVMVLSQDRERAREFYNLILQHIHSNPLLAGMIEGDPKQSETKLSNGSRIINKAGGRDGKALRGYSVDLLIIDEADFIPNPVFVAGEQCTASVRGKIWLISTPNRKATTFYKYFNDGLQARRKYKDLKRLSQTVLHN